MLERVQEARLEPLRCIARDAELDVRWLYASLGAGLYLPALLPNIDARLRVEVLGENLPHRVYGPELMRRYSQRCATQGHRVWLYGGRDQGLFPAAHRPLIAEAEPFRTFVLTRKAGKPV